MIFELDSFYAPRFKYTEKGLKHFYQNLLLKKMNLHQIHQWSPTGSGGGL